MHSHFVLKLFYSNRSCYLHFRRKYIHIRGDFRHEKVYEKNKLVCSHSDTGGKKEDRIHCRQSCNVSAHEHLIICPHGVLRVGGRFQKTPRFLQTLLSCNAAPRITKDCITGKTLGGTFDHYIGLM